MEWYHQWKREYKNHKKEYEEGTARIGDNVTCEECYPIESTPVVFEKFWNILLKFESEIASYNGMTIRETLKLLSMENEEREDTIHKGECRNILDNIIKSI